MNTASADPDFTSAEDTEDPMVFMQLDIKNVFGSLCARLVLDVLSGMASRDYSCVIKVDEAFETAVHELRTYFGFFKLGRACESVLRFYSYDGATNYLKKRGQKFLTHQFTFLDPPIFLARKLILPTTSLNPRSGPTNVSDLRPSLEPPIRGKAKKLAVKFLGRAHP